MVKKVLIIIGLLLLTKFILWPVVSFLFATAFLFIKLAVVAVLFIILARLLGIRIKIW